MPEMATDLFDLTVPVFVRSLTNLGNILTKGETFAKERGVDPAELISARLAPDMDPLTAQVQRACDSAKLALVRLAEVENEAMDDVEQSFPDLQARIRRTVAFLERVQPDQVNGQERKTVVLTTPRGEYPFVGTGYVLGFAQPNFYFHVTTAYAILRMKGVPIGKLDFLGGI